MRGKRAMSFVCPRSLPSLARAGAAGVACVLFACRCGTGSGPAPGDAGTPSVDAGDAGDATVEGGRSSDAGVEAAGDGGFGTGTVDRAAHPLASLLLVPGALQDEYNAQSAFEPDVPRLLLEALESRLEALDTTALGDGPPDPVDWIVPDAGTHPLLPAFATDVLLVDTALPCTSADGGFAQSYFELDREAYLSGPTHQTCGGRTPNEPAIDETLMLLITGDRDGGPTVAQGIAVPDKPATTAFPYLADPH